jgi:DNA-binding NarL/FixJ family response regulator
MLGSGQEEENLIAMRYQGAIISGSIGIERGRVNRPRILIVDDSELMCTHLAHLLTEEEDAEILGAAFSVADALRYLVTTAPDLAILDIELPDGSGIEIIKKIRGLGYKSRIAVFTHYPFPQYREKCLAAGADHFFDKYMDLEKLLSVVRELKPRSAGPDGQG